jgi:hypothetical protein
LRGLQSVFFCKKIKIYIDIFYLDRKLLPSWKKCFVHPIFGFWSLLATKLRKYYVIFVYILQGKTFRFSSALEEKRKENHATKVTKIPRTKKQKYVINKTGVEKKNCKNKFVDS